MPPLVHSVKVFDNEGVDIGTKYNANKKVLDAITSEWLASLLGPDGDPDGDIGMDDLVESVYRNLDSLALGVGAKPKPFNLKEIKAGQSSYF